MSFQNSQTVEVDLRSGIDSDTTGLLLGPKLQISSECGWAPLGLTDDVRRRALAYLPHRDLGYQYLATLATGPILTALSLDNEGDFTNGGIFVAMKGTAQLYVYYFDRSAAPNTIAEGVAVENQFRSGWSVVWTGIATSTLYFGHPGLGSVYKILAPAASPQAYLPTNNPISSAGVPTDAALNPTGVSSVTLITGETNLPAGTYYLKIAGVSSAGKEIGMSAVTPGGGQVISGSTHALAFTLPALPAGYVSYNVYASTDNATYHRQATGLAAGLYHLNGNAKSDPADVAATGLKFKSSGSVLSPSFFITDAGLNISPTVVSPTAPEKSLTNGTYQLFLINASTSKRSATISGPLTTTAQVIKFTTPAAYSSLALVAQLGSGSYHAQNTTYWLTPSTTYHLNLSGGTIPSHAGFMGIAWSATGASPGGDMPGITSAAVHLDRLWLGQRLGNGRSQIWFTDPLDPDTIRATNFVAITGNLTSIFRSSVSTIDASAASHLVFGATTSIWVLDGDPTQGNALLRRLVGGIGIADRTCVVETPYGAVFLGTDGQFYLIPPTATAIIPIGHRTLAKNYTVDFSGTRASLAWCSPYVVYCAGDSVQLYYIDLSALATGGQPVWWGPVSGGYVGNDTDYTSIMTPSPLDPTGITCIRVLNVPREALTRLTGAGVKLACVTNKETRHALRVLQVTDLDRYFDLTIGGDSLPEKKPHASVLRHVVSKLNGDVRRTAHVGDSRTDVEAARNAGVAAWAVPYGYNAGSPIADAQPQRIFPGLLHVAEHVLAARAA